MALMTDPSPYGSETDRTGEAFVPYRSHPPTHCEVKTIAFYLPQYHPFAENDRWWGKGFTDWSNVTKAAPLFPGHYQPRLPIHFGFYDLRVPEIMEEQAALAREYGIYGFSYYFYWFAGKVLMETPLDTMLSNPGVDMPFCLTWANENWTRAWDGQDDSVLIAQKHSASDSVAFLRYVDKYFRDPRYIRVGGKPLLIVYRASVIPGVREITDAWREEAVRAGWPGLYLVAAHSFEAVDPGDLGFDAAVEFPPHNPSEYDLHELTAELDLPRSFTGSVFDYHERVKTALMASEPDYKLFRTAMLWWDNTARRNTRATIYHNFTLKAYQVWLEHNISQTLSNSKYLPDERLVFINAWNEWAEGAHLEPDRKLGYGYLQATYDAVTRADRRPPNGTVI